MQFDDFVGNVQSNARLASKGEAVRAIHATLQTLGERLQEGEAQHLAAQLPQEISTYLQEAETQESFDLSRFFERVATRESTDLPAAVHHARAVISVLQEAVSPGQIADVRAQLPEEYNSLFESGSEGEMNTPGSS